MNLNTKCNHEWKEEGNKIICSKCNKYTLKKIKVNDDISYGIKSDGKKYTIRRDRNRYFYPHEWKLFYDSLSEKHKLIYLFLIVTGARIDEALHFKRSDMLDKKRKSIRLMVTKRKAKKIEEQKEGKTRTFEVSSLLYNKLEKETSLYIFLGINNELTLEESKKITTKKAVAIRELMKRHLKKIGIEDWQNFGLHNIRKTHGMWLKTLGIELSEICTRLGHDADTYIKHYGSPSRFNNKDKSEMMKILGGIYGLR